MTEERQDLIARRVHGYYWDEDVNCATAMLKLLFPRLMTRFQLVQRSRSAHRSLSRPGSMARPQEI